MPKLTENQKRSLEGDISLPELTSGFKCDKTYFILSAIQLEANLYVEFKRVIGRQLFKNSFDLPSFEIQVITPCRCVTYIFLC
jgi:hypothetical protein